MSNWIRSVKMATWTSGDPVSVSWSRCSPIRFVFLVSTAKPTGDYTGQANSTEPSDLGSAPARHAAAPSTVSAAACPIELLSGGTS